eukprot:CAMPEP_0113648002 /NCGR_PEP_ID=MMETSP0017_2-20120614/25442_1 /TAXON_ID=2856 /ORGANISM="Cylindrotheca closterium" /LENGTH=74 /DNA_ID=CAMNT_0000560157 /DNA_START=156 /DNA_END=380 /DNA_ORIENTATION=+ /assembly_acc=CAM_ASM_000147
MSCNRPPNDRESNVDVSVQTFQMAVRTAREAVDEAIAIINGTLDEITARNNNNNNDDDDSFQMNNDEGNGPRPQ